MCPFPSLPPVRHLSSLLGNKFDHGAESVMPTLLNLVPNSAKIMASSGVVAIRLILRVSNTHTHTVSHTHAHTRAHKPVFTVVFLWFQQTHYPRLIPIITSNCTSKSVAVRR